MRAAVATRYGPPEVVHVTDVAMPTPAADELLVEVWATTVNRTDCGYRAARPWFIRFWSGLSTPRAPVLGTEFAGVVAEVGADVTAFAPGDRVFGYCEGSFGAHAEYLTVRAGGPVATVPGGMSMPEIAPATEGWHYAMGGIGRAGVERGHDVLVNGATGGIGSAAVQILAALGANVTAVCEGEHAELVGRLGAQRVVDRDLHDFTGDEHVYDLVFDAVGKSTFARCRRLLRPRGVYLTTELGPWSQNPLLLLVTALGRRRRVMIAAPCSGAELAERAGEMIEAGEYRPVIDRTYPLEQIVEAYRYVESGRKVGNVVIEVRGDGPVTGTGS